MNGETKMVVEIKRMDANDVYQALGDRSRYDAVGQWAVAECGALRESVLPSAEELRRDAAHPKEEPCGCLFGAEDVNEEYVSQDEISCVMRAYRFALNELNRIPPEYPTPDEAVYWLARFHLLLLIRRYAQGASTYVALQRRLHLSKKGICNAEVKNLFCEPGEGNDDFFLWAALLVALHHDMDHVVHHQETLNELIRLFGSLADIYYDLTAAVFSTKLVAQCRRAFGAFWRRMGSMGFGAPYLDYLKCRGALDTAIENNAADRFLDVNLCLASLVQSGIGINKCLCELNAKVALNGGTAPQAEATPHKRGPKGAHKQIPVNYAAQVYGVSEATICNWDEGKGGVPLHYPGRDVSIDEFNKAAAADKMAMGKREGVMSRVTAAIESRGAAPSRHERNER